MKKPLILLFFVILSLGVVSASHAWGPWGGSEYPKSPSLDSVNVGNALQNSQETPIAQYYCIDSAGYTVLCAQVTLQMTSNATGDVTTTLNFYNLVNGVMTKKSSF